MKKSKGKGKHGHRSPKSSYRRLRRKEERELRRAALSRREFLVHSAFA